MLDCATLITSIPTEDWDIGDWVCLFRDRVKQLPSVQSKAKTGYWIDRKEETKYRWVCSECGRTERHQEHFCPNCGARMVEPQESEGQRMKLTVEVKNVPDYVKEHRQGYIVARYYDGALWFYAFWQDKAKAEACTDELEGSILIEKAEA